MHRNRNAKIVATLGSASADRETLQRLFLSRADVFRLNFIHGSHADHKKSLDIIREVERPIAVLLDLQGPKLRLGKFAEGPVQLVEGAKFRLALDSSKDGDQSCAPMSHPGIFKALSKHPVVLIDDGRVRLIVDNCGPDFAETILVAGGTLAVSGCSAGLALTQDCGLGDGARDARNAAFQTGELVTQRV